MIPVNCLQDEWSLIEKLLQAQCGAAAQLCLVHAAWRMGFRRVDVGYADSGEVVVEGVAVHDAVITAAGMAEAEIFRPKPVGDDPAQLGGIGRKPDRGHRQQDANNQT